MDGPRMDQLQGQLRFDAGSGRIGPSAEQVPRAQAEVFGRQQPDADLVTGDLVGQQLPHLPFEAGGVAGLGAAFAAGALGLDLAWGRLGVKGVEFFFEGRNRR